MDTGTVGSMVIKDVYVYIETRTESGTAIIPVQCDHIDSTSLIWDIAPSRIPTIEELIDRHIDEIREWLSDRDERKARTEKNWPAIRAEHQNHFPCHQAPHRQRFQRKEILRNHARDWPARMHDKNAQKKQMKEIRSFLKKFGFVLKFTR